MGNKGTGRVSYPLWHGRAHTDLLYPVARWPMFLGRPYDDPGRPCNKQQSIPQRLSECNRPLGCSYTSGIQHHINVDITLLSFTCLFQEAPCKYILSVKRKTWQEPISYWAAFIIWDCDAGYSPSTGVIFKLYKSPYSPLRESPTEQQVMGDNYPCPFPHGKAHRGVPRY